MLYTIHFTTQKLIHKYDVKGKLVSTTKLDTPITMTALPRDMAMSYKRADNNFVIEPYEQEQRKKSRGSVAGIGNGTKKFTIKPSADLSKSSASKSAIAKPHTMTRVQRAAVAGNMTEAING